MLNAFADRTVLTAEIIERFVGRVIVFRDGGVHVEMRSTTQAAKVGRN